MANYPVKYFDSTTMIGMPPCRGTNGDLIAILDALLVNGFNVRTPATNGVSVSNNECTISFPSAHGFIKGQIVKVSGATGTGAEQINGEHYVTYADTGSIKFTDITGVPDGAVAGTIEVRAAPLGWEKPYANTNIGVYRSADPAGTRLFLRVQDDQGGGRSAKVVMYENMTDANTGTGPSTVFGNHYWIKAPAAGSTPYDYRLVGDSRLFYLAVRWYVTYASDTSLFIFGDINSFKAGDAYGCMLNGKSSAIPNEPFSDSNSFAILTGGPSNHCIARAQNQLGGAVGLGRWGSRKSQYSGCSEGFPYPNPSDNGILLHPILLEDTGSARGMMPGAYQIIHPSGYPAQGQILSPIVGLPGRRVIILNAEYLISRAAIAVDITGPWR